MGKIMATLTQANVSHSMVAQDLFIQRSREVKANVVVDIMEPHYVNERDDKWWGDEERVAAILTTDIRPFGRVLNRTFK